MKNKEKDEMHPLQFLRIIDFTQDNKDIRFVAEKYKDYMVTKNDISYVVRNRDGYLNSIPVKVLKTYEGNAIVTNYTNEELTTLGFSKEKINSFKKLVIYDELVVNPSVDLLLQ